MTNYREILRLYSLGSSQRSIAREVQSSRDTVADVIKAAKAAGITWPLDDDVANEDIQEVLFPGKYAYASPYTVPDYQWIHAELAKKGVTLTLLWDEYCRKVRSTGGVPYMYTQFCEKYRRWARVTKATMRITHKPGDAMQVDWAGDPLFITDSVTGELTPAYIFVAVLPCSWYTYAEACDDMKQENWLLCHAYAYFGGVTRLLIPDNAKTATITNNRYEVVLNRSYQEMAEHYGTAIVPARVRKPDDKAAVEGSVRFVSTWITAALRDRKFFSIAEAKAAVQEKLEELNLRPFKKPRTGCRLSAYEQEEKDFMQPLPTHAYEPSV
jgi:transposase